MNRGYSSKLLILFCILVTLLFSCKGSKSPHQKLIQSQLDSINQLVVIYSRVPADSYDKALREELQAGGNPNTRDTAGIPVLVLASHFSSGLSQISVLLEAGADPNASDKDSMTALHFAASRGDSTMAALLLKSKANPNLRDTAGLTPLMYAVMQGAWENYLGGIKVVQMLIDAGADVNALDKTNFSVLQAACNIEGSLSIGFEKQRVEIIKLLLEKGAKVAGRNANGLTALDMAKKIKNTEVIDLLKEYAKKQAADAKAKK
jgi:uncharacterized protein